MQSTAGIIIGVLFVGLVMGICLTRISLKKVSLCKLPFRAIIGFIALIALIAVGWKYRFSLPFAGNRPLKTFNEYPIWMIASKNLAVYREMKIYPDRIEKQITFKKISPDTESSGGVVYEVIPKEVAAYASLVSFSVKPKIITEDPTVMYEASELEHEGVTASWTVPNPEYIEEQVANQNRSRKATESTSQFLERFTMHWPTLAQEDPVAMWKKLYEFSKDEMQKNAKLVTAGKTITVSKDIVDIAAVLATGTGILDAMNLASEVYSIGATLFGEDTGQLYDYAGLALTGAGILKSGVENKELLKATYQTGILAIKQGQGVKAAANTGKLAKAMDKVSDNTRGASAIENAGINIAGSIIDYTVINQVAATNKYILFEMGQQAQMTMLSAKLVELWQKYERGSLTEADAKQIMELEMLFFTVQQDELRVRKEYLRTQQGILDTAFSLIPVAGNYSAKNGIKKVNETMKLGQDQLIWRLTFRDKVYAYTQYKVTKPDDIIAAEQQAIARAKTIQDRRDPVTTVIDPGTPTYTTVKNQITSRSVKPLNLAPRITTKVSQPTATPTPAGSSSRAAFRFSTDSFPATLMGYPKTKTTATPPAGAACYKESGAIGYLYAEYSKGTKTYAASVIDCGTAGKAGENITGYPACFTSLVGSTVKATVKGSAAGYSFYTLGSDAVTLTSFIIVDRYMITMTTLVSGNSENNQSDLNAAMTELIGKMFNGTGSTATAAPAITAPSGGCQNINLGEGYTTYYFYKSVTPCSGYSRSATSSQFSVRCNQPDAQWREFYVKEVPTGGAGSLSIKASLNLTDHAHFFIECSGTGVKSDNYVFLSVLGSDPRSSLASQCNRAVSESDWPQCALSDATGLGSCGVAKCTTGASCAMSVNTSGKDKIYIVFRVSDAWMADIEGSVSNVSVCPQ